MIAETPTMLLNPLRRVIRAYDRAIDACDDKNFVAAFRGINLLRASLELDSPYAIGFDGIFAWCEGAVSDGDFEGSARHLRMLREAWALMDVEDENDLTHADGMGTSARMLRFTPSASSQAHA